MRTITIKVAPDGKMFYRGYELETTENGHSAVCTHFQHKWLNVLTSPNMNTLLKLIDDAWSV